ncbi:MAG: autotransporter outer membrane beta-barrel domain-containing protein [Proteobacteria bacterium]|nr:autotransporter outer membrane beta-barrel domain-containing protein [Pseudomonadota bacterium]NOG60459.1 autotransporter outer membrane beta-barrel domain-containing protein [Pseudomonadota bacterium]
MKKKSTAIKVSDLIKTGTLLLGVFTTTNAFATSNENQVSDSTPGSTATDFLLFNTQIQNTASSINGHISSALAGAGLLAGTQTYNMEGTTGLNAGDIFSVPYGVWGNYSYSDFDNDLSTTAFDGSTHGFLGGIDFLYWESTVFGIAFGYDNSDIDTTFNTGNQDTDSFTFAPYFGTVLTDTLSLDFNIGYSNVQYDQYRTAAATRIFSSPNADRWFGSLNLNALKVVNNWILGARVGALFAKSNIDSYTESDTTVVAQSRTKVGTISIAGDVAYSYGNFEPFINLAYQNDFSLQNITTATAPAPSNDKNDILMTAGIRYFEKSGISGNLEYSKRLVRDNFDEDRFSLTFRIDY